MGGDRSQPATGEPPTLPLSRSLSLSLSLSLDIRLISVEGEGAITAQQRVRANERKAAVTAASENEVPAPLNNKLSTLVP